MDTKQDDILGDAYEQWKMHPITKEMFKNLLKHKQTFIDAIALGSTNPQVPDSAIRQLAVGIKNVDSIITMLGDYRLFRALVERK